jgi:hypothetical protein
MAAAASNNYNFSTFGPLKGKRSSYAPASGSSGVMLIPPPAASLESSSRFQDRYRSNSLDSILVADLDKQMQSTTEHIQEMVAVHHHSQRPHASSATYHVYTQQHHFIPKHQLHHIRGRGGGHPGIVDGSGGSISSSGSGSLQKRPTFEALDKRKSWTIEQQQAAALAAAAAAAKAASNDITTNGGRPGSQQSRISAYQNTQILNKVASNEAVFINNVNTTPNSSYDPRRKKPVPLPRSKIPVLLPGPSGGLVQQPQRSGGRFLGLGPRSKVSFHINFVHARIICLLILQTNMARDDLIGLGLTLKSLRI